jgi:multiple sugar transport system permease protein
MKRRGWLFVVPWALGFVCFTVIPLLASLYFSFTNYDLGTPPTWAGLQNWEEMLRDGLVWRALWNSAYYTGASTVLSVVVALVLALILNGPVIGRGFFRTIIYLPSIVPALVSSLLWLIIYSPYGGLLNSVLGALGLPQPLWLQNPSTAMPALVLMAVWGCGTTVVIFLAGLQDVPQELTEAARVDGAGFLTVFRHVTLPMLSPVILFTVVLGLIQGMQTFTQVYVLTNGGPLNSTLLLPLYIFQNAFTELNVSYAACLSWLLFAVVLVLMFVVFRLAKRLVYYAN